VRDELVANGTVAPHHVLPDSTWISFYLNNPGDVEQAIALLQRSYEFVCERAARKEQKVAALRQSRNVSNAPGGEEETDNG
jgi:predicted DNA-binding protein (MmcQ/YjbR family)